LGVTKLLNFRSPSQQPALVLINFKVPRLQIFKNKIIDEGGFGKPIKKLMYKKGQGSQVTAT